jgi:DNA repair exonuclease SbcCD nuclease subunit
MKICILGDTHHGMRGDSLDFHRHYEKFYTEIFFPYLKENGIDTVVQLGDLFDRRKFINFNSLYLVRRYFFDPLKANGINFHTLLGNHDVAYKNTLEVNSSQLLLRDYENITVYDTFTTHSFDGIDIDIVPWLCDDNQDQIFDEIKKSKSQICFGHFEIAGFEMDRGNICHEGIDKSSLKKYDIVLTGHFHHKSSDGHITYVGTPGEMTWADYNDPRGFHIFDTETRELTFIQNPYRIFHKITYDDTVQDFEYWKQFDYTQYKDTYVKVVVINKQNPFMFDTVVDNLYKCGIADLSIVEDFSENILDQDQELIDQAEDTMTILSKYIDGLQLNVEPEKLKTIMRELYVEALNVEKTE